MLNKLKDQAKAAASTVQNTINEKKAAHTEAKQNKWLGEVAEGDGFKNFAEWKDLYEPKGDGKEKEAKEPNMVEKKAREAVAGKFTKKIMKYLSEVTARPLDIAAVALKDKDAQVAHVLNSTVAILLTYRFQYKGQKKFAYIRSVAIDRLGVTLLEAIDAEAVRAGHKDPAGLSPEHVDAIVNALVARIMQEITARQNEMTAALKASPLFAAIPEEASEKVDDGIVQVMEMLRAYAETRLAQVVEVLKTVLTILAKIAFKHRVAIQANLAAKHAPEEQTEEYKNGVKAELTNAIEKQYEDINGKINKFIIGLLGVVENDAPEAE